MRPLLRPASRQRLVWACLGVVGSLVAWEAVSLACRWIASAREKQAQRYKDATHLAFETWLIAREMEREYLDARDFARALDVDR